MKKTFLLFMLLSTSAILFGQMYEISIEEKIDKSLIIVEGEIVKKSTFEYLNELWTANEIVVSKFIKGRLEEGYKATIITRGGTLGDINISWTHLLELNVGEKGIFFLAPSQVANIPDNFAKAKYEFYSSSQGFLKYRYHV